MAVAGLGSNRGLKLEGAIILADAAVTLPSPSSSSSHRGRPFSTSMTLPLCLSPVIGRSLAGVPPDLVEPRGRPGLRLQEESGGRPRDELT